MFVVKNIFYSSKQCHRIEKTKGSQTFEVNVRTIIITNKQTCKS